MFKFYFLFVIYFVLTVSDARGPTITKCKDADNDCILKSAKAVLPYMVEGIPEYGIPPATPIELKSYSSQFDKFIFTLTNVKVNGLDKTELIKIIRDPGASTIEVVLQAPILVKGNYEAHGELLSVPIEGNGDFEISVDNIVVDATLKIETLEKDGNKYYKINDFTFKYEITDYNKLNIILNNLFDGDKEKAEPVNNIINSSKPILVAGIAEPIVKDVVDTVVYNHVDKFFQNVPVEELEIA
ncbi:hypothetical protein K1T71_001356 [Dendrolimus kikuchii]|uniref:Uncharacterized protein n=1 Tax=Dendrolimus kikuchii TaxID=765133 RepID=A0ACC1DHQ9_9NEOP|nr:hypothetical protein K1T71_001356 [Dendrolimus kikuchii]